MNWNALKSTGVWVHAVLSAGLVGAATAITDAILTPPINWKVAAAAAAAGALRGIILHIKAAPLPPIDTRRFDSLS